MLEIVEREDLSMAIEANVIPGSRPQIGGDILTTLRNISAPRVIVPTNAITIGQSETLTIDGSLVVNGSLTGTGVPSGTGSGVSTIGQLQDVSINSINLGQILVWDGTAFANTRPDFDLVDGAIDGGIPDSEYVEAFNIDGGFV